MRDICDMRQSYRGWANYATYCCAQWLDGGYEDRDRIEIPLDRNGVHAAIAAHLPNDDSLLADLVGAALTGVDFDQIATRMRAVGGPT